MTCGRRALITSLNESVAFFGQGSDGLVKHHGAVPRFSVHEEGLELPRLAAPEPKSGWHVSRCRQM